MNKRQNKVLNRLKRDGLLVSEAIHRVGYDDVTAKASERGTTQLLRQGLICSHQLDGARKYYTLTPKGAREIDYTDRRAGEPFVAQGLFMNYAIMSFCLLGKDRFERMTRPEFCAKFPLLVGPRVLGSAFRTRYFLDHTDAKKKGGAVRLALAVCDLGSRLRRIQKKARREVQKRAECSEHWKLIINSDLFSISILTFSKAKAERLETLLEGEKFHVRVSVVPGLDELLFGRPAK
jgi:hypothetical protein